jgi:adenylate cyclase
MDVVPETREARELVICFVDLSVYTLDTRRAADDAAVADIMDRYYERLDHAVVGAGGRVVKFIGDGALFVFPPERADAAVVSLMALKSEIDAWLGATRWESHLVVKLHCGTVIAGPFGGREAKRFDLLGDAVNVTARLPTRSFAMSPQVFRLLSPEIRKRLKKHTPPITYIPVEDRHP